MANFKNYNSAIQSRLEQAMEQYKAAESLLHDLEANREAADTVIELHDSAIKGVKKEMLRLEKQMAKDSLKQINNLEKAGVRLVDSDYLAGSYVTMLVESRKLKDNKGIDITPDNLHSISNEKLFNALEQYRKENLSPIKTSLDKAIDAGHQVTETSKEVMHTLKQDGIDLKDAAVAAGIDAKLAANEARLGFMRKTKDLTQGIKHQFDRLNEWRKDHGLTFHDINEALKADRQEYKENFAEKWDGIKDSFNNTIEKVHDSIQEFNDYQAVQQMEAERQMNMRLLSIEGTKAVQCEEQIHKLALRREKIINTVNKAITFGNKTANKVRETLGYDTKEPNIADASKAKMFDKRIIELEKNRVKALTEQAKYIAQNIQITNQEKEYSQQAIEKARNQSFKDNRNQVLGHVGKVIITKNPFHPIQNFKNDYEVVNTAISWKQSIDRDLNFKNYAKDVVFSEFIKSDKNHLDNRTVAKTTTPVTQTLYNIDQMIQEQEAKKWIIDVSTDKDKNLDLDKALALAVAYKAGMEVNYLKDQDADTINVSTNDFLEKQSQLKEADEINAYKYLAVLDSNEERAVDEIVKDITKKEDKEVIEAIKTDVFMDKEGKEKNLYLVEIPAKENETILKSMLEQNLMPEDERDNEFLDMIMPSKNPTYASIDNSSVGFKVFSRPSDAIKYVDAVKRNTGMELKAFGNTEQAKTWLINTAKDAKYQDINEKAVKQETAKVEVNKIDKTLKIKNDDEMEL